MLTSDDIKIIKEIVSEAVAPLVTREEAKNFATKDDLKGFATKDDLKGLATKDDLKGLATKTDLAVLDTKLTRFEVNMTRQFTDLKVKTTKDTASLEKAIKREHKLGSIDFGHLENEDRKIITRVEKIEQHLGFASA